MKCPVNFVNCPNALPTCDGCMIRLGGVTSRQEPNNQSVSIRSTPAPTPPEKTHTQHTHIHKLKEQDCKHEWITFGFLTFCLLCDDTGVSNNDD